MKSVMRVPISMHCVGPAALPGPEPTNLIERSVKAARTRAGTSARWPMFLACPAFLVAVYSLDAVPSLFSRALRAHFRHVILWGDGLADQVQGPAFESPDPARRRTPTDENRTYRQAQVSRYVGRLSRPGLRALLGMDWTCKFIRHRCVGYE